MKTKYMMMKRERKKRRKIIRQIRQHEKEKLKILYSNIYPTRCNVTQSILSGNCSTCFGWYYHPSPGAQTTVSTASGIHHTVTATCRYRGRAGTGLSVLWQVALTV